MAEAAPLTPTTSTLLKELHDAGHELGAEALAQAEKLDTAYETWLHHAEDATIKAGRELWDAFSTELRKGKDILARAGVPTSPTATPAAK